MNGGARWHFDKRVLSFFVTAIARPYLLPSSIRLIDLQDRIPMIALSGNSTVNPLEILRTALQPVIDRYNYIIIDCPPSLGTVTTNGLRISTGHVIPTSRTSSRPGASTRSSLNALPKMSAARSPALGIVATKVQVNNLHSRVIADLRVRRLGRFGAGNGLRRPPLFNNSIAQTVTVARGADVDADIRT